MLLHTTVDVVGISVLCCCYFSYCHEILLMTGSGFANPKLSCAMH
jgi:hypothetical protein